VRPIRIIVVDRHDLVTIGFSALLARQPWVERCVSAPSLGRGAALAAHHEAELAAVDLFVVQRLGRDAAQALRDASPGIRVLLMSAADGISPRAAREAGIDGFVSKTWTADRIVDVVHRAATGERVLGPVGIRGRLSARELSVLELIAQGATNEEIAGELLLSPHTVKQHTRAIYRKLAVRNRSAAVRRGQHLALIG
jgi:DNA-binding NarL/FixJ family response regulator